MRIVILDSSQSMTSKYGMERLKHIIKDHGNEVVAIITNINFKPKHIGIISRVKKKIKKSESLIFIDLYYKIIKKTLGRKYYWVYSEIEEYSDFSKIFSGPIHKVEKINSNEVVELLKSYDCDVAFHSGGMIIRKEVLSVPKIGVIGYHHGDIEKYRGPFPAFWELYNNEKEVGVTVQILNPGLDTGPIICKKYFNVNSEKLKNIQQRIFWETATLGSESITKLKDPTFSPITSYKLGTYRSYPSLIQTLKLIIKGKI